MTIRITQIFLYIYILQGMCCKSIFIHYYYTYSFQIEYTASWKPHTRTLQGHLCGNVGEVHKVLPLNVYLKIHA